MDKIKNAVRNPKSIADTNFLRILRGAAQKTLLITFESQRSSWRGNGYSSSDGDDHSSCYKIGIRMKESVHG